MEMINGYPCKTCTDVDYAKKNIDPAHLKDGPYGVNRQDKPTDAKPADSFGPAVKIDSKIRSAGQADSAKAVTPADTATAPQPDKITGRVLDVVA